MDTKIEDKLADSNDLEIGQRLRYLRESRELNAKDLSKAVRIPFRTYQSYEYSERMPAARSIRKLSEYYDVSADFILGTISYPLPLHRIAPRRHVDGGDDGREGRGGKKEG